MNNSQLSTHNSPLIPPGYKQTEVGVIPEDWDTPELGAVLKSMQLGGNYKNSERETSWPLIKMGNLGRGSIKLAKLEFIDPSQPPTSRDRLRKDDVLFNTRNTLDLVGKVALWRDELPEAFFNSNIMRMEFNETRVSSKRFMNYILNTPQSLTRLRGIAIGTTSVAAIYGRDLVKVKVPLPTGTEQEAIAEALSDADALIESLEQLLVKKRQLKQGAMQELLTGKKRLPGFEINPGYKQTEVGMIPEDWEVRPMLSTVRVANGQVDPKVEPYRSMTLVAPDHIESGSGRLLKKETASDQHAISGKYLFAKGDIVYSKIRPYLRKATLADFDGLCSADMYPLRPAADVSAGFILAAILGHHFSKYAESVSVRSGMPKINRAELAEYTIALPPTKAEQEAIATILSDMDAEIAALEAKRAKARQLKQGMMQELLTGKIRLV